MVLSLSNRTKSFINYLLFFYSFSRTPYFSLKNVEMANKHLCGMSLKYQFFISENNLNISLSLKKNKHFIN